MRDLGGRFEHRLFLSATPHNGHSNSFSTLLELLDPYRFTRGVKVKGKNALEDVMVRRLKEDIRDVQGGFPKRRVERVSIDGLPDDAPELILSHLLDEYRNAREERFVGTTRRAQAAAGLLVVGLQQRLLSSIEAFARSLKVHRATVKRQWEKSGAAPDAAESSDGEVELFTNAPDSDDERGEWSVEELEAEETAQIEAATAISEAGSARDGTAEALWLREQALLDRMQEIAEKTRHAPDAKGRKLIDWIREHLCPDLPAFGKKAKGDSALWNNRRVLIFTENREGTKRHLKTILDEAIEGTDHADERIGVIDGLTSGSQRKEIQRRFNTDPSKEPLRILLATDAAREGLNFQAHCADLFHFDLPWNPGRIEQRNGRIDRKLQPAPEVRCHYFVLPQRVEDRVLEVLVKKTETIKKELGSLSKVIDDDIERRLKQGIRHRDAAQLAREIEQADLEAEKKRITTEELEAARERQEDLNKQIEQCRTLLAASRTWTGFEAAPFREALSCSLSLLGAEPLAEAKGDDGRPTWIFPRLDRRAETDASWAATLDTLRVPRKQNQKIADWRREAPIRPVVFEDAGVLTEDTVHLHLEQRVAQRLLARFRSQGFIYHDLSRACLAQASDSIPRVILLGRLSLYGRGAERLHEELVPLAARWIEPSQRKAPLPDAVWRHSDRCKDISSVIQLHRLREVLVLVGFTRLEAVTPDINGEYESDVERAQIALEPSWFPAVENRGEGMFIQLRPEAVRRWLALPGVQQRLDDLVTGHRRWAEHRKTQRPFPGGPFVLLHTLSHLLIESLAMRCGYPASSLRERVYADEESEHFGVMLYTGSPDADGTLGGLVQEARHIEDHLDHALRAGALCSNDPICAQHSPIRSMDGRWLLGAACHGCALVAETSCEVRNDYLDRALVVPVLGMPDAAFFQGRP